VTRFMVSSAPLSVAAAVDAVVHPGAGAVDVFIGIVRNVSEGLPVHLLEYQAYESMAARQMRAIAEAIEASVEGTRLSAFHRVGALEVGEIAVVCAASAPHRHEAFAACRLLIDRIKQDVPVWKREHGPNGPYWVNWSDARCSGHENKTTDHG